MKHGPVVPPDGAGPLAYLAQNPGETEEKVGQSLVGPTGIKLWGLAQEEGLPHRDIPKLADGPRVAVGPAGAWVGNVVPVRYIVGGRPTNNIPPGAIGEWLPYLEEHLPQDVRVIVALGGPALHVAATAHLPPRWRGISDHAGSVIPPSMARGLIQRNAYVVPIPHPSFLLQGGDQWTPLVRRQLRRAATILATGKWEQRTLSPVLFAHRQHQNATIKAGQEQGWLSIDIETTGPSPVRNISIGSFSTADKSWCYSGEDVVALTQRVIDEGIPVVMHNGALFDLVVMARCGLKIDWNRLKLHDTLWLDAILRPRMPHRLHQVAAYWCEDAPWCWKWMGELPNTDEYRRYCCNDSWRAGLAYQEIAKRIEEYGLQEAEEARWGVYPVVWECALKGLRVDRKERKRLQDEVKGYADVLAADLAKAQGAWAAKVLARWEAKANELLVRREQAKRLIKLARKKHAKWVDGLTKAAKEAQKALVHARAMVKRLEGGVTTKQTALMLDWLYFDPDGLRLPVQRHPKSKRPTMERRVLARLATTIEGRKHPELRIVSALNRLATNASNHLGGRSLDGSIDFSQDNQLWGDGRVTVNYHPVQMRLGAGRGSSIDADLVEPTNYQVHNITKRTRIETADRTISLNLRTQFVADLDGMVLTSADYASMEDYLWYWRMGDEIGYWDGLRLLYDGEDLHSHMAADIFKGAPRSKDACKKFMIPIAGSNVSARERGKAAHHAFKLGAGARMLQHDQDIPKKEAYAILARLAKTPRGAAIKRFQAHIEEKALRDHRVFTPFKEYVDFWSTTWDHNQKEIVLGDAPRAFAVVQQGAAANVIFRVLGPMWRVLQAIRDSRIVLVTHDEITVQHWPQDTDAVRQVLHDHMSKPWEEMPVPWTGEGMRIPIETATGRSWG